MAGNFRFVQQIQNIMVQFFCRFESAIYILRKELLSSDIYKIFEVKKWWNRNDFRISERTNPRSHLKREFDEKKWLNMNSKPDKECEKRDDIVLLSEIIANSIYWQVTASFDMSEIRNVKSINHRFREIWLSGKVFIFHCMS